MLSQSVIPSGFRVTESYGEHLEHFSITCSVGGFGPSGRRYTAEDAVDIVREVLKECVLQKDFFYLECDAVESTHIKAWVEDDEGESSKERRVTFTGKINHIHVLKDPKPFREFLDKISRALVLGLKTRKVTILDEHGFGWTIELSAKNPDVVASE